MTTVLVALASCTPDTPPPGGEEPGPPPPPPPGTPVLSTANVTGITVNAASAGGNVTADGGAAVTARGVCWGTAAAPTVAGNKTSDGSGTGSFTSSITGLSANTTYYVRAYATNSVGTAYGNEHSFTTSAAPATTTVTDIDGNVYQTVQIGSQIWMKENLKVTKYNDGTAIPEVTAAAVTIDSWIAISYGAWCYYDNNSANNATYGRLYNWYAVNSGKLAPPGWHVPTFDEWLTLLNHLGGDVVAGGKMKTTTLWATPNVGATNSSGFTGLPAGGRGGNSGSLGAFGGFGTTGVFWSATLKEAGSAWAAVLSSGSEMTAVVNDNVRGGYSIRLVKD